MSRREACAADVTYGTNNEFQVRLPPRQHGHGAGPAGAARALLRDRRRGRQHPHRRGADAADHQRPGRGIRRPVLHVRAAHARACASAGGLAGGRRGRGRLLHRPQGPRGVTDRGRRRQDREAPRRRQHVRRGPALRPALRAGAPRSRLYKRDRDYIVKDGEIVIVDEFTGGRCPAGAGARASTRRSRPRRACGSARERDPRHDHVPELLPAVRQARRA